MGIFMGGCNIDQNLGQDMATFGLKQYQPGEGFKQVPIFLSNGSTDPIAGPDWAKQVKQSMETTGFRKVRRKSTKVAHQLNQENLKTALEWFKSSGAKPASASPKP